MADRLPQYPMMPNFNPALMQQQQQLNQQQQAAQQQQDPHQSFPDSNRMWQQMQQIPYNRPPGVGGDMNQQQPTPQMMEIMRARLQQQKQQQQQQQFALSGQQMPNMGGGPVNGQQHLQNQSFMDSGSNQSQAPGFPSGMPNPAMQQQPVNRNAMLQAFQAQTGANNAGQARQLEMLLAQQNQSAPMNLTQRLEHQRAQQAQQLQNMNQASPGDLFAPGVDRRPSPGHPNIQGPIGVGPTPQQLHQQQQQQQRLNIAQLPERIKTLSNYIQGQERTLTQLGGQRGLTPDAQLVEQMRPIQDDIKVKKELLAKLMTTLNNYQQQVNGTPWNMTAQMAHSPPQGSPQVGQSAIVQGHASPLIRQQAQQQQLQQLSRMASQGQGPPGAVPRPPSVTRTHQSHPSLPGAGPSFASQLSPNMNPQFPFSMNSGVGASPTVGAINMQPSPSGTMQLPPPLEKSRFDNAYKSFCATKNVKHDPRMMNFEGRDIDLYMLHTHVMQEGGEAKVTTQDLWGVIGGKMGFVHFPASETEPAKAGPGLAQRLAQVYREYLSSFDQVYISSVLDSKRKMAQVQAAAQAAAQLQTPAGAPPQSQPQRGLLSSHQMQLVIGYANQSVEELRRQGVQEKIIQFVEANRSHLQRSVMEQRMFHGHSQLPNQAQRRPDQLGPARGPPFPVTGQQHPNFPNHSLQVQGGNFVDNRQSQVPQPPNGNLANQAQQKQLFEYLQKIKQDYRNIQARNARPVDVPMEQRAEYISLVNQLFNAAQELDKQLPTFYLMKSDDLIKKVIAIIVTVSHQRTLLQNSLTPRFVVTLDMLRNMMQQVHQANERMNAHLRLQMGAPSQQPQQHPSIPPGNLPTQEMRPPFMPPQQQQQPIPPQALPSNSRLPVNLRPPPMVKKPSNQTPGAPVSTPTPPYSATTPVASAATPTQSASSPTPKSPKVGKTPAKPKNPPKPRRPSTVRNPSASTPTATAPPEQPPTPSATGATTSSKRPREDEMSATNGLSPSASTAGGVANEPSPPKRPKTESEWTGPPSEAVTKKVEAVENIKTEEDASAFLEQMTELIKMAGEGQEALSSDISDTLDQILKGYGTVPDGSDALLSFSSFGSLGEPSSQASSNKPHPDEFVEFFDFSSFTAGDEDNDSDSKAPTPELSSTGPSPDSGSEADAAHNVLLSMEVPKTEDLPDLLRLGPFKEIDGGESAYYHTADGWKWDSPMPTLEQPWAIFNS